jgi:hypothetical protein
VPCSQVGDARIEKHRDSETDRLKNAGLSPGKAPQGISYVQQSYHKLAQSDLYGEPTNRGVLMGLNSPTV